MVASDRIDLQVNVNGKEDKITDDLHQLYLDAFTEDIKESQGGSEEEKKKEIAGDLESLKNETGLEFLYNEADEIDTTKTVEQLDGNHVAAFDAIIGRGVIGEVMGDIMYKHLNKDTKGIDLDALEQEYGALKLYDNDVLKPYLASQNRGEQQKYVDMILGDSAFATSYMDLHMQKNVISPMQDAVKLMTIEYNKYFDTTSSTALNPNQIEVVDKIEEEMKSGKWREKRDTDTNRSVLKWGAVIGTVGGLVGFVRGAFGEKKKKDQGLWNRFKSGIGNALKRGITAGIPVGIGVKLWMDNIERKKLTFEESLQQVIYDADTIVERGYERVTGLEYNGNKVISKGYGTMRNPAGASVESYVSIDKRKRTIEGMDIIFSDHLEMLHACNLMNFLNLKHAWEGDSPTPFVWGSGGDLFMRKGGEKVEVFSGGFMSSLWKHVPSLNTQKGKFAILQYLHSQPHWSKHDRPTDDSHIIDTPAGVVAKKINKELEAVNKEKLNWGGDRDFIEPMKTEKPNEFIIKSWDQEDLVLEIHENDTCSIKGYDRVFTTLREGILIANFTNFISETFQSESAYEKPFYYGSYVGDGSFGKGFYIKDVHWKKVIGEWITKDVQIIDMDHFDSDGRYDFFANDIAGGAYMNFLNKKTTSGGSHRRSKKIDRNKRAPYSTRSIVAPTASIEIVA